MTTFNYLLFWVAVFLSVVTIYKVLILDGKAESASKELVIPDKVYYGILGVAVLAALFVRLYQFGVIPGGFNQDGAMAAVDANALADYGTDRFGMRYPTHLTAWGYSQMSALLSYLMIPFNKLFGITAVSMRAPQLLVSLLGLACLYFLVRDIFGKNIALVVFCFAAINPWHILQSRWALEANLYPHFFLFGVFFLNLALRGMKRKRFFVLSMIMFGLCMYCYGVSIYTMPLFLVVACAYLLVKKQINVKEAVLSAVVYLIVGGPFILTMAINYFQWDTIETPLFTMPYFQDSVRSDDILFFSDNFWPQLVTNFNCLFDMTVQQMEDTPWNNIKGFGTIYLFSFPFAFAGAATLWKKFRKKPGAMLVAFFLMTGIWCGLVTNNTNINRINIIYYPIIILAGIGIYSMICHINLSWVKYGTVVVYAVAFGLFANTYFTTYAKETNYYFFNDFCDAVYSLRDTDYDKYYITTVIKEGDESPTSCEILTMFWMDIDIAYYQGKTTPEGELPYSERFTYATGPNMIVDAAQDAAYVVQASDLAYFDSSLFHFEEFGSYYVVTRNSQ